MWIRLDPYKEKPDSSKLFELFSSMFIKVDMDIENMLYAYCSSILRLYHYGSGQGNSKKCRIRTPAFWPSARQGCLGDLQTTAMMRTRKFLPRIRLSWKNGSGSDLNSKRKKNIYILGRHKIWNISVVTRSDPDPVKKVADPAPQKSPDQDPHHHRCKLRRRAAKIDKNDFVDGIWFCFVCHLVCTKSFFYSMVAKWLISPSRLLYSDSGD